MHCVSDFSFCTWGNRWRWQAGGGEVRLVNGEKAEAEAKIAIKQLAFEREKRGKARKNKLFKLCPFLTLEEVIF